MLLYTGLGVRMLTGQSVIHGDHSHGRSFNSVRGVASGLDSLEILKAGSGRAACA